MSSFVRFVLKYKKEDTAFGDVARDILMDSGVNRAWGYKRFVKHLESMNASQRVYTLVEELKVKYEMGIF